MAEIIIQKTCTKCKSIKPVSEFHKDRSKIDGLFSWCKKCKNSAIQTYRRTEIGKKFDYYYHKIYQQGKKGRENNRRIARKQRLKYPAKIKARNAINNAVIAGKLPYPKTLKCYYCGKQAQQYHHWKGYDRENWLDVVSVCKSCDIKQHKLNCLN